MKIDLPSFSPVWWVVGAKRGRAKVQTPFRGTREGAKRRALEIKTEQEEAGGTGWVVFVERHPTASKALGGDLGGDLGDVLQLDAPHARMHKWLWVIGVRPAARHIDTEEWLDEARAALMRVVRETRKIGAYADYLTYEPTRDIIYLGKYEVTSVYQLKYLADKAYNTGQR
jgi:hypothetical protein